MLLEYTTIFKITIILWISDIFFFLSLHRFSIVVFNKFWAYNQSVNQPINHLYPQMTELRGAPILSMSMCHNPGKNKFGSRTATLHFWVRQHSSQIYEYAVWDMCLGAETPETWGLDYHSSKDVLSWDVLKKILLISATAIPTAK